MEVSIGKSPINGPFSIAMFEYRRVLWIYYTSSVYSFVPVYVQWKFQDPVFFKVRSYHIKSAGRFPEMAID